MADSPFTTLATDHELEKASNSYLMSTIVVIVGLPLPILNLIATAIFYLNTRTSTFFVRWHCTQALLSQALTAVANSIGFSWTLSIIFGDHYVTNQYIAYILTLVTFNLLEFVATIYAAIRTRKGIHTEFWFFGPLTRVLCKK